MRSAIVIDRVRWRSLTGKEASTPAFGGKRPAFLAHDAEDFGFLLRAKFPPAMLAGLGRIGPGFGLWTVRFLQGGIPDIERQRDLRCTTNLYRRHG
jgi:hypothetical protein